MKIKLNQIEPSLCFYRQLFLQTHHSGWFAWDIQSRFRLDLDHYIGPIKPFFSTNQNIITLKLYFVTSFSIYFLQKSRWDDQEPQLLLRITNNWHYIQGVTYKVQSLLKVYLREDPLEDYIFQTSLSVPYRGHITKKIPKFQGVYLIEGYFPKIWG